MSKFTVIKELVDEVGKLTADPLAGCLLATIKDKLIDIELVINRETKALYKLLHED